jgi:hypothetical protein
MECQLTTPGDSSDPLDCDTSPDKGSGRKLTKFSTPLATPKAGDYQFEVSMLVRDKGELVSTTTFVVQPGPAVRFSVTGLVHQDHDCCAGDLDCFNYGPSYPRQIAKITALDAHDNVATGYAGTVSFKIPGFDFTPMGLSDIQLTDGVGYVPVVVPQLGLGVGIEPMRSACPGDSFGVLLSAVDTVDPTIFGCQSLPPVDGVLRIPESWFDIESGDICPGGCKQDPTGSIAIDTVAFTPVSLSPVIAVDAALDMKGYTASEFYFTQNLTVGQLSIIGTSIPTDDLALCVLCTTDIHYYADNTTGLVDPATGLIIGSSSLQVDALVVLPWDKPTEPTFVTYESVMASAATPTCYLDSQLTVAVTDQSLCFLPNS